MVTPGTAHPEISFDDVAQLCAQAREANRWRLVVELIRNHVALYNREIAPRGHIVALDRIEYAIREGLPLEELQRLRGALDEEGKLP